MTDQTPETPENEIELNVLTIGMHLQEFDGPEDVEELAVSTEEPFIILRPCMEDGLDLVLDVLISQTPIMTALAMVDAAKKLLLEELRARGAAAAVEDLLLDIQANLAAQDGAE